MDMQPRLFFSLSCHSEETGDERDLARDVPFSTPCTRAALPPLRETTNVLTLSLSFLLRLIPIGTLLGPPRRSCIVLFLC
jgi:hypothetical protein